MIHSRVLLGAVLTGQAAVGIDGVEFTGRVHPVEVDVGGGQTGESAEAEKRCPHYERRSMGLRVSRLQDVKKRGAFKGEVDNERYKNKAEEVRTWE